MILTDLDTVLTGKVQKFICDMAMYDIALFHSNSTTLQKTKVILQEMMLKEFDKGVFDSYMDSIQEPELKEEFESLYINLKNQYVLGGSGAVLRSSQFLPKTASIVISKNKRLYGSFKESLITSRIEHVAANFDLSAWETNSNANMFGLIVNGVNTWLTNDVDDRQMSRTGGNVVRDNEEGFFVREDVDSDALDTGELFDSELFVELMTTIYAGSAVMFQQSSHANLKELLSSTINYLQDVEVSRLISVLSSPDENRIFSHKLDIKDFTKAPYKFRENGLNEGHLVYKTRNYMVGKYSEVTTGRLSLYNRNFNIGNELYRVANEVLIEESETASASVLVHKLQSRLLDDLSEYQGVEGLERVLVSVINARRLQEILKRNGYNILQFPSMELRQGTWNRFSNLYEILNYYRVHTSASPSDLKKEYEKLQNYRLSGKVVDIVELVNSKGDPDALDKYMKENFSDLNLLDKVSVKTCTDSKPMMTESAKLRELVWTQAKEDLVNLVVKVTESAYYKTTKSNTNMGELNDFSEVLIAPLITNTSKPLTNFEISGEVLQAEMMRDEEDRSMNFMGDVHVELSDMFMSKHKDGNLLETSRKLKSIVIDDSSNATEISSYANALDKAMQAVYANKEEFEMDNGGYVIEEYSGELSVNLHEIYLANYVNLMNSRLTQYMLAKFMNPILIELHVRGRVIEGYGELDEETSSLMDKEFINMTTSFSTLIGNPSIISLLSRNVSEFHTDFVDWYVEEYGVKVIRNSRFTDFFKIHLSENNKEILELSRKIYKSMTDYLDSITFKQLSTQLKLHNVPTGWKDVKELVMQAVELHELDLYGQTQTYEVAGSKPLTINRNSLQTLPGSSIIGKDVPYMESNTPGSYFIFSVNGYKLLVPDAIDSPIQMREEEQLELLRSLGVM